MHYDYAQFYDTSKTVLVFGNEASASLAAYCLEHDSPFTVCGFFVGDQYRKTDSHEGKPLFSYERLEAHFTPKDVYLLVPVGYQFINGLRRSLYEDLKARGYQFISYVASSASIWPHLVVNDNVLIYEHAIIQPYATVGHNSIIRSGAHLSHHCSIEPHSFVAAEVAMGGKCRVGEQSFIGVGAVLADSITLATKTFVGAGAVVVKNTEPEQVYVGNPAKPLGKTSLSVTGG